MKLVDFFSTESNPIGDVHSPLLMDSSHLHDDEKKPVGDHWRGEERRSSAAGVVVAREFFPLTPDQNTKEVGGPRRQIDPAQPKQKSVASPTDSETLIVEKKAKYNRTQKEKKEASGCDTEEERRNGVSTELVLLYDPYKIKKKLTQSDLGHLSRLLIGRDFVASHLLQWMSEETVRQVESGKGADVIVRDVDTCSEHRLVFVFWALSGSYVLKGGWIKEFVKRRALAAGNEVGIYWDPSASKFHFSLLHKAN
ncbi:putative B3 domain-containing protein At1g78640 [Syzygium oleosum]|uniref:putative B3 domain-containing protein At1g78640 n=1 Tax=Syzygium oleosum TaxID=219896 RepID=UPI0011D2C19B|nr:putative B3 domain-containing protein At1g78640 [Syzygium oleosum]